MQMSTLDSYQYSNNTTMACIWAWERCRPSVWKRLQKKNETEKNGAWLMFSFPLTKTSQQRKTARHCKTPMKSHIVILRLVVFTRFPANRDCLLKLYMLVKSARTVFREFGKTCLHWAYFIWLTESVGTILCCCVKLVFMLCTIERIKTHILYCLENDNFNTS